MHQTTFLKQFFSFILISIATFSFAQNKINVILLGTYHFNNPGNDEIKTIEKNILTAENQEGLEQITNSIVSKYKPDQIFVESSYHEKDILNNQYWISP